MIGGQFLEVPQQLRVAAMELARTKQTSVPSTSSIRSSHSRARYRPRNPVAPVSRTVRTSALGPGSVGAAASVSASTNFSSVRSLACTSVASRPCTDAKLGPLVLDLRTNCWLKLLTDGAPNKTRTGSWTSKATLILAITRIAEIESPPMSKNESSTPTRWSPSTPIRFRAR